MLSHSTLYPDPVKDTLYSVLHHVDIVLSLLVNLTFVTLILVCKRREFGAYRMLLLMFALVDIYYGTVHFLVMPIPESWANAFCMAGHGYITGRVAVSYFGGVHSHSFVVLVFHFLYRLMAIQGSLNLSLFSRPWFFGFIFTIVQLVGVAWFCILYVIYDADEFAVEYVEKILKEHAIATILPIDHYTTAVFWTNGTFVGTRWKPIGGVILMVITMAAGYSYMLYSDYRIKWHMQHDYGKVSERTSSLQKQFMRALKYQTILPLLTAYSPPLIAVVTPLLF